MDILEKKYPIVENEHLYAVLNLSKYASQAEINERHRHLSLIFHPDKQIDEKLKAVATKEFLEIQKAYQVLSDPFLRQVYDTLGSEGLSIKWPPTLRSQTKEQILDVLNRQSEQMVQRQLKHYLIPRGRVHCAIDATPLFSPYFKSTSVGFGRRLVERFKATRVASQQLGYTVEKKVSEKTVLSFTGQTSLQNNRAAFQFLGTIRHHYSPRLVFLSDFTFHHPFPTRFEVKYEDPDTIVNVKTAVIPPALNRPPPLSISVSRRLFRSSNKRGKIDLNLNNSPSLSFFYVSPPTINLPSEEEASFLELQPPTIMGLRYVVFERAYGLVFDRILPILVAETSMTLVELSTRFKASIQLGLSGLMLTLGAHWSGENTEAGASLLINTSALLLQLDLSHMGQQLALPIVLSDHNNPLLALGTIILPSTATLLAYHFFIIPRRRARRYAHIRAAKKDFDEDTDSRRERNAVERLLRDAVKRQVRHETDKSGLIIQEAIYAVAESDLGDVKDNLSLDVTIPLQALVHNSQLHIPGGNTKAALQGFSDPAPFASKVLRIRYLFRGRMHYAEIPDYLPVVLPLSGQVFPWMDLTNRSCYISNLDSQITWLMDKQHRLETFIPWITRECSGNNAIQKFLSDIS